MIFVLFLAVSFIAGGIGGFMVAAIMVAGKTEDTFRAGYRAGALQDRGTSDE